MRRCPAGLLRGAEPLGVIDRPGRNFLLDRAEGTTVVRSARLAQLRELVATPVLMPSERLKAKVRFVGRDDSPADFITPKAREFEKRDEGWTT